eukprot:3829120-Pyramimonas_sp.AAC.1
MPPGYRTDDEAGDERAARHAASGIFSLPCCDWCPLWVRIGLGAAVKPLIRPSTAGNFTSSLEFSRTLEK